MQGRVLIICAFVFFFFHTKGQRSENENKIDPAFRSLLAEQKQENKRKSSSRLKKEDERSKIKDVTTGKKYECIIYTKNAKAIKDKGILINSALPTFVTAIVSLDQIKQLSMMDEVSYIEASKNNYPNK